MHETDFKENFTNTPLFLTERVVVPNASPKTSPTVGIPTLILPNLKLTETRDYFVKAQDIIGKLMTCQGMVWLYLHLCDKRSCRLKTN